MLTCLDQNGSGNREKVAPVSYNSWYFGNTSQCASLGLTTSCIYFLIRVLIKFGARESLYVACTEYNVAVLDKPPSYSSVKRVMTGMDTLK